MEETFTCDGCNKVFPVSQRNRTVAAVLNPYPEDLDLCDSCDSDNQADLYEIASQMADREAQRREESGYY